MLIHTNFYDTDLVTKKRILQYWRNCVHEILCRGCLKKIPKKEIYIKTYNPYYTSTMDALYGLCVDCGKKVSEEYGIEIQKSHIRK